MKRAFLAAFALASVALFHTPGAHAGAMTLTIRGTAFGVSVSDAVDVTDGFSGFTIPLASPPMATLPGFAEPAVGSGSSLNSSFNLGASLNGISGDPNTSASLGLTGVIRINFNRPGTATDLDGSASGSATADNVFIPPGVDPSTVPSWFSRLGVQISGFTTGGSMNLLQTSLSVVPGTVQVPEPPTIAVVLLGLACVVTFKRTERR